MLIAPVVLYLLLTIAIGLWAARRVHNSRDYVVAGRSVPLFMSTAFLTAALGSIPQQDVFQRVTAAKDADTAVRGALLGGLIYFCMAFVPIYLAYCALLIDPKMVEPLLAGEANESQLILPNLIAGHTPLFAHGRAPAAAGHAPGARDLRPCGDGVRAT